MQLSIENHTYSETIDLVQPRSVLARESATSPIYEPKTSNGQDLTGRHTSSLIPSCVNESFKFTAECHATTLFAAASSSEAARHPHRDFTSHPSTSTSLTSSAVVMNAAIAMPTAVMASRVGGIAAKSSVKQLRRASAKSVAPVRCVVKASATNEVRVR